MSANTQERFADVGNGGELRMDEYRFLEDSMKIPDNLPWGSPNSKNIWGSDGQYIASTYTDNDEEAEYIIHACNMYPELVKVLNMILDDPEFDICGESKETKKAIELVLGEEI